MTTLTAFQPTATAVFQFQATFDGVPYIVRVPWLAFGARWYIEIVDQGGNLVVNRALVGSPSAVSISSATWADQVVTVETVGPHGFVEGESVMLTIEGITPTAYNGDVIAFITGPSSFTYRLQENPGADGSVNSGSNASYDVSLTENYFASTLVFREATQTFEVSP